MFFSLALHIQQIFLSEITCSADIIDQYLFLNKLSASCNEFATQPKENTFALKRLTIRM